MRRASTAVLLAAAAVTLVGCASGARVTRTHAEHPLPVCARGAKPTCDPVSYRRDPFIYPDPKGAPLLTRAQIDAENGGKGVTVAAVLVTYGQAHGLAPGFIGAPHGTDPTRQFWLVTDYYDPPKRETRHMGFGPTGTSGPSAKVKIHHDSFMIDAATGRQTDACQGCAAVPESNANWPAAAKPTVSKERWAAALRRGFKTKTVHVRLVWADVGMSSVDLEWLAYAQHGSVEPISHPLGFTGQVQLYVGPVGASIGAFGGPPEGSWSVRPPRGHHIQPLQSRSIPVALVRALANKGFRIALTSYLARPTISRRRTLETLDPRDPGHVATHIWLVYLFGAEKTQLTWLIERRDGPYEFVSATSGNVVASEVNP